MLLVSKIRYCGYIKYLLILSLTVCLLFMIGLDRGIAAANVTNYMDSISVNGNIIRWQLSSGPIKVYVEPVKFSKSVSSYNKATASALNAWSQASKGKISFCLVESSKDAQIKIFWEKKIHINSSTKGNALYFSGFTTPNYLNKRLMSMQIRFNVFDRIGKPIPLSYFERGLTHELGHALGIMGHSDNKADIMYPFVNACTIGLSQRDKETFNILYKTEPDISNFSKDKKTLNQKLTLNKKQRIDREISRLKQEIKDYPLAYLSYNNLGLAYQEIGLLDKAIECYKKAVSINNRFDDAYTNLGEIYRKKKLYDLAIVTLNKAIGINPSSAYAYNNLGNVYYMTNRYELAKINYEKALSFKPELACAKYNLNLIKNEKNLVVSF